MRVLFIFPYPTGRAASQRFRFEQYFDVLESKNIEFELAPFLDEKTWNIFYKQGFILQKIFAFVKGMLNRFLLLLKLWRFDFVFIHREATPIGPPIIEWLISMVFRKKIIFDFDDAIWIANSSESNRFFSPLKSHSNVFRICKWSYKVSVGNDYLKKTAESYNKNVFINPTTIDTINHHNRLSKLCSEKLIVGWTGSHSTNKYLDPFFDVIRTLKEKHDFIFRIISDEIPNTNQDIFEFIPWSKEVEIQELSQFNVGVMPLTHDPWSEGKCGFKALQYMSLGIPALVSPVGINEQIVDNNVNGFICRNHEEWVEKLEYLIENHHEIERLGIEARKKVEESYSVTSNSANFILLFT